MNSISHLTPCMNSVAIGAQQTKVAFVGFPVFETVKPVTGTFPLFAGASLRAAGWVRVKELPPRAGWAESSQKLRDKRDPVGNGGVARVLWEIRA